MVVTLLVNEDRVLGDFVWYNVVGGSLCEGAHYVPTVLMVLWICFPAKRTIHTVIIIAISEISIPIFVMFGSIPNTHLSLPHVSCRNSTRKV